MKNIIDKKSKSVGIIYILLAAFFFSLMTLFIRLAGDLPTIEKAFFRNAFAALFAIIMLIRSEDKFHVKRESLPSLFLRASFGLAGIVTNFWAIDHLVLSDSNILNKMSPFFAIIMSIFILKEVPNRFEWFCVFAAFTGALFVVKPTAGLASMPALVGLLSGFFAGTAYTFVRKLGKIGERGPVIVCFFSTFSTLILGPLMIMDFKPMSLRQLIILTLCGVAATGGQLSITAAYSYAPAKEISVFDYSQVVFAAMLGLMFFGEIPDIWSMVGYTIIIITAVIKWRYGIKQK